MAGRFPVQLGRDAHPPAWGGGSAFASIISVPKGRRRPCAVQAFCRRQNLGGLRPQARFGAQPPQRGGTWRGDGGIYFRRAFQFSTESKKKDTTKRRVLLFGAGNEARTRFPASREWLPAIRRNPASPLIKSRLRRGVEAASSPSNEKTGHPTLGVLRQMERATRLELASRHPANGSPPFAGTLPHL